MQSRDTNIKVTSHIVALIACVAIVWITNQNPRVLLYAQAFSVLYRFIAVSLLSSLTFHAGQENLVARLCCAPQQGERSRPYKDQRTGKKAGLAAYIAGMVGVFAMLAVVFEMASGSGIAHLSILLSDLYWGCLIGLVYLIDDLASKQVVIAAGEPVPVNLGYNVTGLNFLIAAIFISAFLLLVIIAFVGMVYPGMTSDRLTALEWVIFVVLVIIRCMYDIRKTLHKPRTLP